MARENLAFEYGRIVSKIKLFRTEHKYSRVLFDLEVLRITGSNHVERKSTIPIDTETPEVLRQILMERPRKGDLVFIKGNYITSPGKKYYTCNICNKQNVQESAIITYLDPVCIKLMDRPKDDAEAYELMKNASRTSNRIYMDSFLCRNPVYYTDEKKMECDFQTATNRKRKLLNSEDRTDYPWFKVFGQTGFIANNVLETGSEVYTNGVIQTRLVHPIRYCKHCDTYIETEDTAFDIVPEHLGFRRNCNMRNAKDYNNYKENIVYLYGYVSGRPKTMINKDGECEIYRFSMTVIKRRKRGTKGKTTYINHEYKRITVMSYSVAQNKKLMELMLRPYDMVMVHGTLTNYRERIEIKCEDCGYINIRENKNSIMVTPFYVKPLELERSDGGEDAASKAKSYLDHGYEISNQCLVDVVVNGDVMLSSDRMQAVFQTKQEDEEASSVFTPRIRVFSKNAEESAICLRDDSEVLVNGRISESTILYKYHCKQCEHVGKAMLEFPEIHAYSLEYHEGCDTEPLREDEDEQDMVEE